MMDILKVNVMKKVLLNITKSLPSLTFLEVFFFLQTCRCKRTAKRRRRVRYGFGMVSNECCHQRTNKDINQIKARDTLKEYFTTSVRLLFLFC